MPICKQISHRAEPKQKRVPPQLPRSSFLGHHNSPSNMASIPRVAFPRLALYARCNAARQFHSSPLKAAVAHPITAHGPPPKAPEPATPKADRGQSNGSDVPQENNSPSKPSKPSGLKARFWKDVHVEGKSGMFGSNPLWTTLKNGSPSTIHDRTTH